MTPGFVPAGSRKAEPAIHSYYGEEMHSCGYCGTRTVLDDGLHYATGVTREDCPHCGQHYLMSDDDDDGDSVPLEPDGEIEIVDEVSGQVIGMTSALDGVLSDLEPAVDTVEASLGDLDHLFGVAPSPYGNDFGSF